MAFIVFARLTSAVAKAFVNIGVRGRVGREQRNRGICAWFAADFETCEIKYEKNRINSFDGIYYAFICIKVYQNCNLEKEL